MKIRNGFVSNSSTSSFVLIVTKKAYDKALSELDKEAQSLIKIWSKKGKFNGQDIIYFHSMSDTGGSSNMYSEERNDKIMKYHDYVDKKYDGDFSAVFLDDFCERIPKEDKFEVWGEI